MGNDNRTEFCTDTREITGNQGTGLQRPEHSFYAARRLTPTECARLQGFPDDWCNDVLHSDSAEYKLWGNGIALPCLLPMMAAMAAKLGRAGDSDGLEEEKMIQMTRDEYNEYCRCVQVGDEETARAFLKALEHRDKIDRMVSTVYVGETICRVFDEYHLPDEPRVVLLGKILKGEEE